MSDNQANPPSRGIVAALSLVMIAAAILFFYLGVTHASTFKAPPWIAYVIGVMFLAWGTHMLATAFGRAGNGLWLGFIFIGGIATVFWWIALAGDPGNCSASFGPISLGPRACQIGFGFGAVLCSTYAIFIATRLFRRGGPPRSYY